MKGGNRIVRQSMMAGGLYDGTCTYRRPVRLQCAYCIHQCMHQHPHPPIQDVMLYGSSSACVCKLQGGTLPVHRSSPRPLTMGENGRHSSLRTGRRGGRACTYDREMQGARELGRGDWLGKLRLGQARRQGRLYRSGGCSCSPSCSHRSRA